MIDQPTVSVYCRSNLEIEMAAVAPSLTEVTTCLRDPLLMSPARRHREHLVSILSFTHTCRWLSRKRRWISRTLCWLQSNIYQDTINLPGSPLVECCILELYCLDMFRTSTSARHSFTTVISIFDWSRSLLQHAMAVSAGSASSRITGTRLSSFVR